MQEKRTLIRNILCAILCVLLAGGLAWLLYTNRQEQQAQTAAIEAAVEEAKPYEQELDELEEELDNMEAAVSYTSETASIMVGFTCSDEEDLAYAEELAETYQFPPVLALDCTMAQDDLEALLTAADDEWEIMLYTPTFSEEVNEEVLAALDYLETVKREHSGVFLLRNDYSSEAHIQLLLEDGFLGYTSYNSHAPDAGQTEDGAVYFDYSYLTSSGTTVASRLSALYTNKSAMLVVFDMASVGSDSLPESYVTSLLDTMRSYTESNDCVFSTVAEVTAELSQINAIEAENQAEYEEQATEMQERIVELEEIIEKIYDNMER